MPMKPADNKKINNTLICHICTLRKSGVETFILKT